MKFHLRRAVAVLFVVASGVSTLAHAASVSGQGTWETTLQGRDLDGNLSTFEAYYDTSLNITWLANAGAATNWTTANAWAGSLNPYGSGITGWRLPTVIDTDGPDADALGNDGCNSSYNGTDCGYNVDTATGEMAHMFYTTLGNLAYYSTAGVGNQPGWGLTNTGPFSSVQIYYWSATESALNTNAAWFFYFYDGRQAIATKGAGYYAWAVHAGDVGAVPIPAAVWLFGTGLAGLFGFARRKKK